MGDELFELFRDLDRHFGTGETYCRDDRQSIAEGVIPEWLMRGKQLLTGPDQARCAKAIDHLKGLHAAVWKQVDFKKGK